MKWTRAGVVAAGALVAAVLLSRCLAPTEMVVDIVTDVPCSDFRGVGVAVGSPESAETASFSATSTSCDANGNVGSVVLVPSGSDSQKVGIRVVAGHDRDFESCASPPYGAGCIVARRQLDYLPHQPLHLQVFLYKDCDGIACDPASTCANGACRGDTLSPGSCTGTGCGDPPPGGGPIDAGIADAESDAGLDAGAADYCGMPQGLAASTWPMAGRCPTKIGRAPIAGPQTNTVRWTYDDDSSGVNTGPVVGSDGTVYYGSNAENVFALYPDGGAKYVVPVQGNVNGSTGALAADGTLYVSATWGGLYAITPDGDASVVLPAASADQFRGAATIASDGTVYMGSSDGSLYAVRDGQTSSTSTDAGGLSSPAIAVDGTIYSTAGNELLAFAPGGAPSLVWTTDLGGAATPAMIARDGNVYAGAGSALVSVAPSMMGGTVRFRATLPALAAEPAIEGPTGVLYVLDEAGNVSLVDPGTGAVTPFTMLPNAGSWGLSMTLDVQGTLYLMGGDQTYRAYDSTGAMKWSLPLPANAYSAGAIGPDGTLYFGVSNGALYAVGP